MHFVDKEAEDQAIPNVARTPGQGQSGSNAPMSSTAGLWFPHVLLRQLASGSATHAHGIGQSAHLSLQGSSSVEGR